MNFRLSAKSNASSRKELSGSKYLNLNASETCSTERCFVAATTVGLEALSVLMHWNVL